MSQPAAKICVKCQRDVAHEKRVKDPYGHYFCAACYDKARRAAQSVPVAASAPSVAGLPDDDIDLAPAPTRRVPTASDPLRNLARSPALTSRPHLGAGGGPSCPCCCKELDLGEKLCIACGIQVPSGRPVITSLGRDLDALYGNAEAIIRWLAWFLWLGLYPIASEAYAIKKPIVIWVVAALTTLTSIGFFVAYQNNPESQSVNQLMLWPKSRATGDDAVLALYRSIKNTDKDASDIIQMLADDPDASWAKLPERERLIAACRSVGLGESRGDFRWYQLLTNVFLHDPGSIVGFILHLVGNMLFLLIFGTRVNALIGNFKMALLYPLLGILASAAHLCFTQHDIPMPALGASGAIMGLAGMYLIFFPVHKVYVAFWIKPLWWRPAWIKIWPMRGFWVLGFYISFDVVATLLRSGDNVAHWAHLGGFIAGITIAALLLVTRQQDARHADLFSFILGKTAWPLIGKPTPMVRSVVVG